MLVSTPVRREMGSLPKAKIGNTRSSQSSLVGEIDGCGGREQVRDSAEQSKDYIWRGH
jgi:hypothetical protein